MAKLRTRYRYLLVAVTLVALAIGITYVTQPARRKGSLVAACEGADRIIIELDMFSDSHPDPNHAERLSSFTIDDSQQIEELFTLFVFEPCWTPMSCSCNGEIRLRFCQGEEDLVSLTVHHAHHLRWIGGSWPGDAIMTPESRSQLAQWFEDNGCPSHEEIIDMRREYWSTDTATQPASAD